MTIRAIALSLLAALALTGCGADGAPDRPAPPPETTTNVGVSIGTSGYASVGVSVSRGPVTFGFGF